MEPVKGKLHITFDIKSMGIYACVPIVVTLLLLIYGWVTIEYPANFIPIFEYTIPVTASWWSIFLFRDILEESGSETIFTYPMPRWKLGLAKVLLFFLLYLSLLLLMLFILELRSSESIFLLLALQLGIQAFFMAGLGFLSMVICANTGWALLLPLAYTFYQILPPPLLPQFFIFFLNEEVLDLSTVIHGSVKTFIVGVVFFVTAQYLLHHFNRYH